MSSSVKICPICKKEFIIINKYDTARRYCYECSPANRGSNYIPLVRAMRRQVIKERGGKCERCGYDKCFDALCFHHIDPFKKEFSLSQRSGSANWEKFSKEAEKCIILCANCHAEVHKELRDNELRDL